MIGRQPGEVLTPSAAKRALPRIGPGLTKYLEIQARLMRTDVGSDRAFQRSFNGFYRLRRTASWQAVFYNLLEREKLERRGFEAALRDLHGTLGRCEASFASKLVATADPSTPVLDSIVLRHLRARLPAFSTRDRIERTVRLYHAVREAYERLLRTTAGESLVAMFRVAYPAVQIHEVKVIDLLLWQTR